MGRPKSVYSRATSQYVGTKDAAAILGVSVSTVHKMLTEGKLHAWKTNGGHRRVSVDELRTLAGQLQVPQSVAVASDGNGHLRARQGGPLRVLVVEDNPAAAKSIAKILERFGDRVRATTTGDAAEALMKIAEEQPHLVITDLIMEPFDGFHLLKVLKSSQRYSGVRIIVITGVSEKEIQARGGISPEIPVYRKPIHPERLTGFIDALLQQIVLH